jgi:hypothetical protein
MTATTTRTAYASKTHTYRGREICPVQYADKAARGYRWYVQSHHQTGIAYDSGCCAHYYTLAAAKAAIDDSARFNAAE